MESYSGSLIKVIKVVLDTVFVLNFVLFGIALFALIFEFASKDHTHMAIDVRIPKQRFEQHIGNTSNQVQNIRLITKEATLVFDLKRTAFVVTTSFFLLFAIEAIVFITIWQLRRIFSNLKAGQPFSLQNVKGLKTIAVCTVMIIPVQAIIYFLNLQIVGANFSNFVEFPLRHSSALPIFVVSAILYVISAIIENGLELKKENEEFV